MGRAFIKENNKRIKEFRSSKTLQKYLHKQQLEYGLPIKFTETLHNHFTYYYEDIHGNSHDMVLDICD